MQFKECYQNPFIEERADPYITLGPDGYYYEKCRRQGWI